MKIRMTWWSNRLLWRCGLTFCGGTSLSATAVAQTQPAAPSLATSEAPLVFRGVTVIDVQTGQRLADRTVVIVGNRIQALTAAGAVAFPSGATVVDARGRYLVPGFWDMHEHPQDYVGIAFPSLLINGVTGIRDAGSRVPLAAQEQWKREIAAGTRVGPRLIVSGPAIHETTLPREQDKVRRSASTGLESNHIAVPQALAVRVVDSLQAAGADMLKLYLMSSGMRLAMAAEAQRVGIPFGGHSADMPGLEFSDHGAAIVDHETWMGECGEGEQAERMAHPSDSIQCADVMQRFRRNHTWITETGVLSWSADGLSRELKDSAAEATEGAFFARMWRYAVNCPKYDSTAAVRAAAVSMPASTAAWAALYDTASSPLTRAVAAADPPYLVGTDAGYEGIVECTVPGPTLHRVLLSFVLGGLSPLQALRTVTWNPAQALRATDSLGTVAAGKVADLVLLDADPLADIWNTTAIRAVVANGRYYDRAALDRLDAFVLQRVSAARQRRDGRNGKP